MSAADLTLALMLALSASRCTDVPPQEPDTSGPSSDAGDGEAHQGAEQRSSLCAEKAQARPRDQDPSRPPPGSQTIAPEVVLSCSDIGLPGQDPILRSQASLDAVLASARCDGPPPSIDFETWSVALVAFGEPSATISWAATSQGSLEVGVTASAYCEGPPPPPPDTALLLVPAELECVFVEHQVVGVCDPTTPKP